MIKRDLGEAQFHVDKIGQPVSNESGETGKKLLLGSFALVYIVEGYVRITLDENHGQGDAQFLSQGQTLYIERDEEASPTSMFVQASDEFGTVGSNDVDATVVTIQISEKKGGTSVADYFGLPPSLGAPPTMTTVPGFTTTQEAPPKRRDPRRKGSLVVYDEQPLRKFAEGQKSPKEAVSPRARPATSPGDLTGELASTLQHGELSSYLDEATRRDSIALLQGKFDSTQLYEPPPFALIPQDTDVPPPVVRDRLVIEDYPVHTISTAWIKMVKQGLSEWIRLPAIICRGSEDGFVQSISCKDYALNTLDLVLSLELLRLFTVMN